MASQATPSLSAFVDLTMKDSSAKDMDATYKPGRVVHKLRNGRHCWTTYPKESESAHSEAKESSVEGGAAVEIKAISVEAENIPFETKAASVAKVDAADFEKAEAASAKFQAASLDTKTAPADTTAVEIEVAIVKAILVKVETALTEVSTATIKFEVLTDVKAISAKLEAALLELKATLAKVEDVPVPVSMASKELQPASDKILQVYKDLLASPTAPVLLQVPVKTSPQVSITPNFENKKSPANSHPTAYKPGRCIQTRRNRWETFPQEDEDREPVSQLVDKVGALSSQKVAIKKDVSQSTSQAAVEVRTEEGISKSSSQLVAETVTQVNTPSPSGLTVATTLAEHNAHVAQPCTQAHAVLSPSHLSAETSTRITAAPTTSSIKLPAVKQSEGYRPGRIVQTRPGRWVTFPAEEQTPPNPFLVAAEAIDQQPTQSYYKDASSTDTSRTVASLSGGSSVFENASQSDTTNMSVIVGNKSFLITQDLNKEITKVGSEINKESPHTSTSVIVTSKMASENAPNATPASPAEASRMDPHCDAFTKLGFRYVQTREASSGNRGSWERLPPNYVDPKDKLAFKLHEYFPYRGPVTAQQRARLAPRTAPVTQNPRQKSTELTYFNPLTGQLELEPDYTIFEPFSRLPVELKLMVIAAYLADEQRRVPIRLKSQWHPEQFDFSGKDKSKHLKDKFYPRIQPPSTLFVNHMFREQALQKYQNFFGINAPRMTWVERGKGSQLKTLTLRSRHQRANIPFDPKTDTLVLELERPSHFENAVRALPSRERLAIRKLAVRCDVYPDNPDEAENPDDTVVFHRTVAKFENLRQLDLLVPSDSQLPKLKYRDCWEAQDFDYGRQIRRSLITFKKDALDNIQFNYQNPDLEVPDPSWFPRWQPPITIRPVLLKEDGEPAYEGFEEVWLERKRVFEAWKPGIRKFKMNDWARAIILGHLPLPRRGHIGWNEPDFEERYQRLSDPAINRRINPFYIKYFHIPR